FGAHDRFRVGGQLVRLQTSVATRARDVKGHCRNLVLGKGLFATDKRRRDSPFQYRRLPRNNLRLALALKHANDAAEPIRCSIFNLCTMNGTVNPRRRRALFCKERLMRGLFAFIVVAWVQATALDQEKLPVYLWHEPEWFEGVKGSFAYWTGA